ncbi:sigma-70 family RNA polymerase sigma factor [Tuwongella immobilis]|uniref:sigma-70 family RNA polymerase sigma factor n=1 Tax=Tuwongella immobilis TaxID=692036 RepID=UPI0013A6FAD4|nr:sigma-70 family RNA polymerase sigma factor [Tuwongella immobilis]
MDFISAQEQRTLIENHINFAKWVVNGIASGFSPRTQRNHYDAMLSEAFLALVAAAKRFNPAKNIKFSTYAGLWIRSYIHQYFCTLPKEMGYGAAITACGEDQPIDFLEQLPSKVIDGWDEEEWQQMLRCLPHRSKRIIELRYRIGLTLQETAANLGITRERVRQLENKALTRILDYGTIPEAP